MDSQQGDFPMAKQKNGSTQIPDKVYFKIGEVCRLTGVKAHTLRYWEAEFPIIKPQRAGSQQRLYRRTDVENILRIKKMLHEDGMTLAGTRKSLARKPKDDMKGATVVKDLDMLHEIKDQLLAIKKLLK
jgi:DNA-binding transcriptional MerR regulator